MIRVVVLAPVLAVRAGLRALLGGDPASRPGGAAKPSVQVLADAASLADLGPVPQGTDVLLMTQDAASWQELEKALESLADKPALLLLTEEIETARRFSRLPLRAWGFLSVDAAAEELAAAIQALYEGLVVGSPAIMTALQVQQPVGGNSDLDSLAQPLTEREVEVLQWLAQGLANKQIAASLGISEHTVKFHVSSIYAKLGATNRAEAVRLGVQRGLVLI